MGSAASCEHRSEKPKVHSGFRELNNSRRITAEFSGGTPPFQHAGAPALVCALRSAARGRALYVSTPAATICYTTDAEVGDDHSELLDHSLTP